MRNWNCIKLSSIAASLLILGLISTGQAATPDSPPDFSQTPAINFTPLTASSLKAGIVTESPVEETSYSSLSAGRVLPALGQSTSTYTWQVNYLDKSTTAPLVKNLYIDESPVELSLAAGVAGNGTYQYAGTLATGIHNFRFQFTDSNGESVVYPSSGNYSGPTVNTNPTLASGRVNQGIGSSTTQFTWIVNYTDTDNQVPDVKNVYIDGVPHTMMVYSGQAWNGMYIYQSTLATGFHNFYFQFSDSWGGNVRLPSAGTYNGPTVSNSPELLNPQVSPTIGFETATYAFKVDYFDPSGLAPSLSQIILDGSTGTMSLISGSVANGTYAYYLANVLTSGIHTYAYNFTNPYGLNVRTPASGTYSAPTVVQLTAPTNLTASILSYTQVRLNWKDNSSDEDGFIIYYKQGDGSWTYLGYVGSNVTTYTHSGMTPFKWYTYRVYAYKYNVGSGFSNTVTAGPGLWVNPMGDFDISGDTTNFGFETPAEASQQPACSWANTYSGKTGLFKLTFSSATQGLKMTSMARIDSTGTNRWHRMRVTYLTDNFNSGIELLPLLLTYPSFTSYEIKDLGATWTGLGLQSSTTWHTLDTYLYSRSTSGLLQLIVKNNGKPVNVYIDSIEWANVEPPALDSAVSVSVPYGDYDVASDTSHWAYETMEGYSSILPVIGWQSSAAGNTGVFDLYAAETNKAVKQTSFDLFNIPAGKNALLKASIYPAIDNPNDTHVYAMIYGEKSLANLIFEFGANVHIGDLQGNQWNVIYAPLTSLSGQTTDRLQFTVKNNSNAPAHYYLDNVELYYNGSAAAVPDELAAEPVDVTE
jgi:hypothetical protein